MLRGGRWLQGGAGQRAGQQAPGRGAQHGGRREVDGQGPVEQQGRVYAVGGRGDHRPGQRVALPLPVLQEWRRWVGERWLGRTVKIMSWMQYRIQLFCPFLVFLGGKLFPECSQSHVFKFTFCICHIHMQDVQ